MDRSKEARLTAFGGVAIGGHEDLRKMASNTKKSETIRLRKKRTNGRARKRALAVKGTTRNEKQLFGNEIAPAT